MERIELPAMDVIANVLQITLQKEYHVLLCMICGSRPSVETQRRLQNKGGMEALRYCEKCSWNLPVPENLIGRVEDGTD